MGHVIRLHIGNVRVEGNAVLLKDIEFSIGQVRGDGHARFHLAMVRRDAKPHQLRRSARKRGNVYSDAGIMCGVLSIGAEREAEDQGEGEGAQARGSR